MNKTTDTEILKKENLSTYLLNRFCFTGSEILINPDTGSEDTAENWASEASRDWVDPEIDSDYEILEDICRQFDSLIVK